MEFFLKIILLAEREDENPPYSFITFHLYFANLGLHFYGGYGNGAVPSFGRKETIKKKDGTKNLCLYNIFLYASSF